MSLFDKRTKEEKLWDKAKKLLESENFDSAKETLMELVRIAPHDARAQLKLAEVYKKIFGDKEMAIVHFIFAADEYAKDGFYPKTIAIYKEVLELNESRLDIRENMAKLYEKLDMQSEANKQRAYCQDADAAKEKEVLDFIKGKYDEAGKGDERALEFCKNLCIVVLESTEAQIRERLDVRILPAKPQPKKKSPKRRKK
ncbi:MAG: hypothetical protein NTX00_01960 [Candidatus Parcubacteria bacterium]|nr:hypothetical protein [Candidatus Parcubacteria bacterium]